MSVLLCILRRTLEIYNIFDKETGVCINPINQDTGVTDIEQCMDGYDWPSSDEEGFFNFNADDFLNFDNNNEDDIDLDHSFEQLLFEDQLPDLTVVQADVHQQNNHEEPMEQQPVQVYSVEGYGEVLTDDY